MSNQQMNVTQLLDTFQLFDTNKDGFISFDEVKRTISIDRLKMFRIAIGFCFSFDRPVINYKCQSKKRN